MRDLHHFVSISRFNERLGKDGKGRCVWVGSLPLRITILGVDPGDPRNPKPPCISQISVLLASSFRTAVAFHAVAWFTGCKAPREARVVVLPEYQGARGGPGARFFFL